MGAVNKEVKIGQVWRRKNGSHVDVVDKRVRRGCVEFQLKPHSGGRASWKWERAIAFELCLVKDVET